MTYKIGFIGLGTMGLPMATHLVDRGLSVKLYARRSDVFSTEAATLISKGAVACHSISSICEGIDILITNVTRTEDVESILISGSDPVIRSLKKNALVIDHSTIDPDRTKIIAQILKKAHIDMVDAPVSGGSMAAKSGQLIVMMGGKQAACCKAKEVVSAYAKSMTVVGESGHGQIAKLCNQIAQTVTIEGIAESLSFAKSLGADPAVVLSAIECGMGGSPMMSLLGPKMVLEKYDATIKARLHAKDVGMAHDAAKNRDCALPCLDVVHQNYRTIMARGLGDQDTSIVHKIIQDLIPNVQTELPKTDKR